MPPKDAPQAAGSKATDSNQQLSTSQLQDLASKTSSPSNQLQQAAAAAESALTAQNHAQSLRSIAATFKDPAKRQQYLTDAYNKEIEAHGNSKKARVLSSGAFQGGVGGAGIGAAVSAGLGTVVGTLVGGVTALPATAVGGLVGAGTGLAHGPWIKLGKIGGGGEGKDGEKKGADGNEEKIDPEDDDVLPNPQVLREAAAKMGNMENKHGGGGEKSEEKKERKKPRKLEVRNKQAATA